MVKDYAKLNSQSLKATVVPQKKASQPGSRQSTAKQMGQNSKPFPVIGAVITLILALALFSIIFFAFKHRDSLIATKEKVAMWVAKFHHHKDKNSISASRLALDQGLSDPTQNLAADSSQQTLNLPSNINLNSPPPAPKKKPKPQPVQAPQPVFDFYTVLPNGSANNPSTDPSATSSQPTPPPSSTPANAAPPAKFVVDVGYYQDQASANQLRSQLLLMGYTPAVKNTGSLTSPVYQAELGPFDTVTQANQIRQQLQANGFNNIVVHPVTQ
jgi:hypothetical protein